MTDTDPADADSHANKVRHLASQGLVQPTYVAIPLDPDLLEAFNRAYDSQNPLSKTDVLLIQAIRLLRNIPNAGTGDPTE